MLSKTTIIQLGDIHFPTHPQEHFVLDNQDPAFSSRIASAARIPAHRVIERELSREISNGHFSYLVLMGDLTNRGVSEQYKKCLDYIMRTFIASTPMESRLDSIVVLPGNHDINRHDLSPHFDRRFSEIKELLASDSIHHFPDDSYLHIVSKTHTNTSISLTALNTCFGCGEHRNYPGNILSLIEKHTSNTIIEKILNELDPYEHLDTPAINTSQFLEHINTLRSLPPTAMPIFCGHHNILPQTTPRIKIYTEMINAGVLRDSLLSLNRPVVYLHGHTHSFGIDVLSNPQHPHSRIVNISAPQFRDGFNKISIVSNNSGTPIAIEVVHYHAMNDIVAEPRAYTIPLWPLSELASVLSPLARKLEGKIPYQSILYFSDLCDVCQDLDVSDDAVASCLHELYWTGLIRIDNIDREKVHWRISKSVGH